ncbi:hypothetical protein A0256_23370 [Mucilaginibacter sp. PAMC 26640]|nr:hypothetical protein A0256_23370 [Mucilaginibacter sp. PAMC 26640]
MANAQLSPTPKTLTNKQKAFIIEQFVSGTSIRELSNMNGMSFDEMKDICMMWYAKGDKSVTIPSTAVNSDRRQFITAYAEKLSQQQMADALGIATDTVRRWSMGLNITTKKRVYNNPVPFHYLKVSIILNQETGIYYFSATEAADTMGKADYWLNNRIKKMIAKNNTEFIYCGRYKE